MTVLMKILRPVSKSICKRNSTYICVCVYLFTKTNIGIVFVHETPRSVCVCVYLFTKTNTGIVFVHETPRSVCVCVFIYKKNSCVFMWHCAWTSMAHII